MLNETFYLIFNHRLVQFKSRLKNAYFLSHSVSQIDPVSKWNQQSGERSFPRTTKVITYHNGFSQPGKWVSKVFKNPVKSVSKTNIKALFSTWTTIFKKKKETFLDQNQFLDQNLITRKCSYRDFMFFNQKCSHLLSFLSLETNIDFSAYITWIWDEINWKP